MLLILRVRIHFPTLAAKNVTRSPRFVFLQDAHELRKARRGDGHEVLGVLSLVAIDHCF